MRYWDLREDNNVNFPVLIEEHFLPSDARQRTDAKALVELPVDQAQAEKERLENV